ncbi:MAG: hypothetical protein KC733_01335 [Candidatus Omnitrophica bacterium]|nr:hypothetical protein [Candidatus Omnitrophota bacterium]
MFMRRAIFIAVFILVFAVVESNACEVCTVPRLGRQEKLVNLEDEQHQWFFDFVYEQQNWNELPAEDAHELHHDGHDVHDKTMEEFYHFAFGRRLNENISLRFEIPYVVRRSIGIEHDTLGNKETSRGIGDLKAMFSYRIIEQESFAADIIGGVQFPTGQTHEKDSAGSRFEPELQPGSGAYDYLAGGLFEYHLTPFIIKGNATYSFKNEGAQNYKFGSVFSAGLFMDYVINSEAEKFKTKLGIDINYQLAQKDEANGEKDPDSGGQTILAGPTITVEALEDLVLFGTFLYPVYQNLGGLHQELNFVWTLGVKLIF